VICASLLTSNRRSRVGGTLLALALLCLPGAPLKAQPQAAIKAEPQAAIKAEPQAAIKAEPKAVAKVPVQTAACTVRVVHALHDGHEFDPQLEPLRPQLTRPPLSAWHQFKLLKQHSLVLGGGAPGRFELPDGHEGLLTFEELVDTAGKQRLRVRLEVRDGQARLLSTRLLMNNGATMLQAGLKHDKGLLVLGITCGLSP